MFGVTGARRLSMLLVTGALVAAAACSDSKDDDADSSDDRSRGSVSPETAVCDVEALNLVNDGVLTVGTDEPAYPPWFQDDERTNGKGFESAVAYAVAEELGFDETEVTWTTVGFNNAIAPGPKAFDFDINQVSISEERAEAVTFSDGYYTTNQAIVGYQDSAAADATTLDDLEGLKLGAQVGTTSLDFITEVIEPDADPFVYNDNNAAKAALDADQVDAIVLDLPTAFYVSSAEIEGTEVIAQFPAEEGESDEFGLVFEKGNPLVDCVNQALAELKDSGELADLEQQWLSEVVEAPVIETG